MLLATALALGALAPGARAATALDEAAPKRFAIVVGNGDYRVAPDLRNARADAGLVAKFLDEQGYSVTEYADLDKAGFEAMLQRILHEVDKDSEVVFYYAGHGVQIGGANYLIPVDATFRDAYDLPFEAVSLTTIADVLGARARTQILILDSCRSNPFAGALVLADITGTPSQPRDGFNVLTAPVNSLLAFSTSPGANAYDGTGANSPFTAALVGEAHRTPEEPIGRLLEEVRRQVYAATEGLQVPWESSTLVQSVSFGLPDAAPLLAAAESDDRLASRSQATPQAPAAGAPIALTARLDQEIAIGAPLVAALDLPADTSVRIAAPPANGRLLVDLDDGRRVDAARQPGLTAGALATLAYEPAPGAPATGDSFTVAAGAAEPAVVELDLELDPCDREAADHLDPEGVGPGRYPNEIDPANALPACLEAVARAPDVGRFAYQLGRVQLALRDFDAAEASFERARELGHTRAWVALGLMAANADARSRGLGDDAPAPPEALVLFQRGISAGDPYAMHSLGRELLRNGPDEETRRRGFQLLQQAVQFGHTFSMNELGAYYMNPASPDADPPRGLSYIRKFRRPGRHLRLLQPRARLPRRARRRRPGPPGGGRMVREGGGRRAPRRAGTLGRLWNSGALGETGRDAKAIDWYDQGLARCDGWSGANAAWIIANRAPAGYLPRDAAERAAKAAVLDGEDSAAEARRLLPTLDAQAIDGAAQSLLDALGGNVEVDGNFGPASVAEMQRILGPDAAPATTRPSASSPSPAATGRTSPAASTSTEPRPDVLD